MWELRLIGWQNSKLIPDGKLEAYLKSLPPGKSDEIAELKFREVVE
jgi:hypothetical protein